MKIKYTDGAARNMKEIFSFIAQSDSGNAAAVLDRFFEAVEKLKDFPDIGVFPKDKIICRKGYRMLISDNYLIFYKIDGETAVIAAVLHGSRNYAFLLK